MSQALISQRDLRLRSKEIMDSVERGQSFTVTRAGRAIGELIPRQRRRTFIGRDEFIALGQGLPTLDPDRFRADLDSLTDPCPDDPFTR